ncbi:MAG: protecting protein DprA [Frankiales bacterium]|nr:protecting protein DprA [Frankiales bacterium]
MSPVDEDERLARIALARVVEPGSRAVHAALAEEPASLVWNALRAGAPIGQLGQQALDGVATRADGYDPRRDLDRLHAVGGRLLCPGDPEWPDCLDWDPDVMEGDVKQMAPPWALFVRGPSLLADSCRRSVAVVGARASTAYGAHVAAELAFGLAEAGVTVVSGGAYGIDAAAHRAALDARAAPTVAVLACGVDVAYPRAHDRLLSQVAEQGLLVSEVPPGSAPTRVRFLVRNRMIAALSQGTVVVEAARRSGSLSTAGRAGDLGRPVMAVPGPVTSAQSTGCHDLIRQGKAVLVGQVAEVLELIGAMGEHLLTPERAPVHARDALPETLKRVLDAVPVRTPVGVARIARTAGVSALVVQQSLPQLLVAGLVQQRDGGWHLSALGMTR